MKLVTILIFAGIMQLHAAVYSQNTFSLKDNSITVKEMFNKIEKSSNYTLFYRNDLVDLKRKISVSLENASIEDVMTQVLKDQPLTFELLDNMIVIKSVNDPNASKDYMISGTVTDDSGEPLIGASVIVKGTSKGASTDINGRFSLSVPGDGDATLVVTYIGFKSTEVPVRSTQTTISVKLEPDATALQEVVVNIGYGTVRKRDLTGSVASIKTEDIVRSPTHNAMEAIQGRLPGMEILRSNGTPGAGTTVLIRGNKSITTRDNLAERNSPLYIIDGFQGGDINTLNPNDIESIEVLKDASSTAIYGALGANGVIIVTTKRGSAGKTRVSYNAYYGKNKYDFPESRIGEDYLQLRREAWRATDGQYPATDAAMFTGVGEAPALQARQWVNWMDLVMHDGSQQSHDLSISGGSEKTKFFASGGYFKETGTLVNSDFNRYNARINVDQSINKWAKAGLITQVTYSIQNQRRDPLGNATSIVPLGTPYDEFGLVVRNPLPGASALSPLADERDEFTARNNTIRTNVLANGFVELSPIKDLTFRTSFGTTLDYRRIGIYNDRLSLAQGSSGVSQASQESLSDRFYNWDNVLTFNKKIAQHRVTLTAITSYIRSDVDDIYVSGTGPMIASQLFYDLSTTTGASRAIRNPNRANPFVQSENMAYAGRFNYNFKDRYTLYLSGRFDGSSRLATGNKWDFFPSAGVAWNVSEESFLGDINQISNLKLRYTYGGSGNYVVAPYSTQSGLDPDPRMSFGNTSVLAYKFKSTAGNPNLGWERTYVSNFGLDLGLLDRVNVTLDLYNTRTEDILYPRPLPQSTGIALVFQNIGSMKNKGVELAITSQNIKNKAFTWSSTLSFTRNREKITGLVDGRDIINAENNSLLIGRPVTAFYTYQKLGIWQESEKDEAAKLKWNSATGQGFKPGEIKLADISGPEGKPDGVIDATYDRTYIGSSVPDWIGGLQNNFSFKGFDLGVFLFARYGQMIESETLGRYNPGGLGNGPASIDYWTPENPTNDFPRPIKNAANATSYNGYQTLRFVDGSYFKIKNLTLGYTVPKSVFGKLSGNVRVYATASNLLTVAKSHLFSDYDPERGGSESSPLGRQYVFGVSLGL